MQPTVWEGAKALRKFLVPIGDLEPWPGNPRRGDIEAVRASLRRFGQVKPVLVDGTRIVAGHHVRLAAAAEGWTHVAAIPNEFTDEEEARAFLLTDNRTSELGSADLGDLTEHLRQLAELDLLVGTGYTADDLDGYMVELRALQEADQQPREVSFTARPRPPGDEREVVLHFSPSQHEQAEIWLAVVAKETGASGVSETVYEALRVAAQHLNS